MENLNTRDRNYGYVNSVQSWLRQRIKFALPKLLYPVYILSLVLTDQVIVIHFKVPCC